MPPSRSISFRLPDPSFAAHLGTKAFELPDMHPGDMITRVDARLVLERELDDDVHPNGTLRAVVNDVDNDGVGDPEDNFKYTWYPGQEIFAYDTLGTDHILGGLDVHILYWFPIRPPVV